MPLVIYILLNYQGNWRKNNIFDTVNI